MAASAVNTLRKLSAHTIITIHRCADNIHYSLTLLVFHIFENSVGALYGRKRLLHTFLQQQSKNKSWQQIKATVTLDYDPAPCLLQRQHALEIS